MVAGSRWVNGSLQVGTRGARGRSLGRRCATQPPSPNSRNGCRASLSGPPSQQRPAAGRSRSRPDVLPRPGTLAALRRVAALAVRRGIAARALARQGVHQSAKRIWSPQTSALKAHFRPLELRARRSSASGTACQKFRLRRAAGTRRGEERRPPESADIDGRCEEECDGGGEIFFGGDRGCAEIEIWP